MTQSELWLAKWQEAIDFLETNHRKPSKFIPEERNMRSWWKHNKKLMNAGELRPERVEMFERLLEEVLIFIIEKMTFHSSMMLAEYWLSVFEKND